MCYWHALNISRPNIWNNKPPVVVDRLLVNALFAKINTCDPDQSEVFKTFIQHNYKEVMRLHWTDFSELTDCDQKNWLYFVHPKSAERQGKKINTNEFVGLEQMRMLFESLFYKVKVEVGPDGEPKSWDHNNYNYKNQLKLQEGAFKLVDHPADNYIDYNSMIDSLEEEHMRRDVFTTAVEPGLDSQIRVTDA